MGTICSGRNADGRGQAAGGVQAWRRRVEHGPWLRGGIGGDRGPRPTGGGGEAIQGQRKNSAIAAKERQSGRIGKSDLAPSISLRNEPADPAFAAGGVMPARRNHGVRNLARSAACRG